MHRLTLTATALVLALPVVAQVEETASEDEARKVRDAIGQIGCEADEIEKETDDLFEIDDARCEIGQYDIKLNGDFVITSMTYDGPAEEGGGSEGGEVTDAQVEQITTMLEGMQCQMDEANIERSGDGFELDDVFCADGQYDIMLDANMEVVEKRAE